MYGGGYSESWGYAGVSPAPSSASGPVHPGLDLQGTADSAPTTAISHPNLRVEGPRSMESDVVPASSVASPEKRVRSVSPPLSKGVLPRVGGETIGSPSKKSRPPGAAATPRAKARIPAAEPRSPSGCPATGMSNDSFGIFLSPETSPATTTGLVLRRDCKPAKPLSTSWATERRLAVVDLTLSSSEDEGDAEEHGRKQQLIDLTQV